MKPGPWCDATALPTDLYNLYKTKSKMKRQEIKISERTIKMLNLLRELQSEFNAEFQNTPENEFASDTETSFTCHLADLTDDVTALAGYNIRMSLNL